MNSLQEYLSIIEQAAEQPLETAREHCRKTGKKAIGCFKGYVPEELIYALDMVPVGLWGAPVELVECQRYFPAFYCAPVRQNLELGIRGELDFLSGIIVPEHCDTLKAVGQNWKVAVPHIPFIPLFYPHNRREDFGRAFLRTELEEVQRRLEEIAGKPLEREQLQRAIRMCNRYRRALRVFCEAALDYPATITPKIRHQVLVAGYAMDRGDYTGLLQGLTSLLLQQPAETDSGKHVVLTGTMLHNAEVLQILQDNGLTVVADDLLQESRQLRVDVREYGDDPLDNLVWRWANMEGCPLVYDPQKKRGDLLVETVRKRCADGVLFCVTTFCDPDEYDYPLLRNKLREAGIPSLRLELGEGDGGAEQLRTRLQGFVEILSQG